MEYDNHNSDGDIKFVIPVVLAATIALVTEAGAVEITAQQIE
jgi:hypothetical protein